jgi:hypothetical protein
MRKNLGFSQQKVIALSELFCRSCRVPYWLAGEPKITVRHEGFVDRNNGRFRHSLHSVALEIW